MKATDLRAVMGLGWILKSLHDRNYLISGLGFRALGFGGVGLRVYGIMV